MPDSIRSDESNGNDGGGERVVVLVDDDDTRRRFTEWFDDRSRYTLVAADPADPDLSGDLCLLDERSLRRHRESVRAHKASEWPRFYPVLLVRSHDVSGETIPDVADELVTRPIRPPELHHRLGNLLERRRLSRTLVDELEQTERRYRAVFDTVNDAILVVDPNADRIVECNVRATELLDYPRSELVSLSPAEDLHAAHADVYAEFVDRVLDEGSARTDRLTYLRADGARIEAEVSANVLLSYDEPRIVFSIRDVSERREHERLVERQRNRLAELNRITRTLHETTRAVVQASSRAELESEVCRRLSGSDVYRFAWIGERDDDGVEIVPRATGGDAAAYLDSARVTVDESPTGKGPTGRAFVTGSVHAIRNVADAPVMEPWREPLSEFDVRATAAVPIRHDGTVFGVLNLYTDRENAFADEEREILGHLGRNIGRAIAGIRAREEAQLFQQAVEHAGHAIYITETDGTIEYVNSTFEETTGYAAEDAVGETPRILKSGEHDGAFYRQLWDTILSGSVWENEIVNRRRDGRRQYIDQTIAPIFEDGRIEHFVAVNADITEQRRQRQQLQVLYRVFRHNLRNEMNVVEGYLNLIERGDDEHHDTAVAEISRAVDDLLDISDQAQAIERTFVGAGSAADDQRLDTVVRDAFEAVFEGETSAQASMSVPDTDYAVNVELGTAVEELLTNAVEHNDAATPEVTLSVDTAVGDDAVRAEITVRDDGPGIPPNERRVLRDGEETSLLHGSGLGLWLVNWVVTELGGRVEIDDNEPRGSVVTLRVPLRR